jgi:hypothetical protein
MRKVRRPSGVGLGVDASGNPVIDPTENVISLTEAANKRQDDLREAQDKYTTAEIRHLQQIGALRAEHAREIREMESRRLDAIRQVDVNAVKTEADRALAAIQTLAATTTVNAETLRNALTATAAAIAKQTSDTVSQITERIAALEKSSYEGSGKARVADPMMAEMVLELKSLRESRSTGAGKSEGISVFWGVLIAAAGLLLTLLSIGAIVFAVLKK